MAGRRPILRAALSNTQIDKLGDRLRDGVATDDDHLLLALYRESFGPAYRAVVDIVDRTVRVPVTGRPGKTTPSIIAKLRRFRTRLSQMQDVAGCRVVVEDPLAQERTLAWLTSAFPSAVVIDRRLKPNNGYRALHIVPAVLGKPVEIQLRTKLQHLWAELSEAFAFRIFVGLKYGDPLPEVALLPFVTRALRKATLAAPLSEADKARELDALKDPKFVRERILALPPELKRAFDEVHTGAAEVQASLLEGSQVIQSIETLMPGRAADKARAELELVIQGLISSVEKLE